MPGAHHLYSSNRKQQRPKVSQLANGSECNVADPPIKTMKIRGKTEETMKTEMLQQSKVTWKENETI